MRVLYFGSIDWSFIWQRPQQILTRLVADFDYDVEYIQPLGLRSAKFSDVRRIISRAKSFLHRPHISSQGPRLRNLFFIPFATDCFQALNISLLRNQIRSLVDKETLIWVTSPSRVLPNLISSLEYGWLVYEMMDDHEQMHANRSKQIREAETWLVNKADLVITTSAALYEKAKRISKQQKVAVIPNGVDYEFFQSSSITDNAHKKDKKTAGYIGAIDKWFDFDTLEYIADQRKDIRITLVGPVKVKKYPKKSNILYTGPIAYNLIHHYCRSFDVCLLPFTPGQFSDSINPIKFYEYVALGKPVVSYKMRELEPFDSFIYVANDKNDFLSKIELAFAEDDLELSESRKKIAIQNNWAERAQEMDSLIHEILR